MKNRIKIFPIVASLLLIPKVFSAPDASKASPTEKLTPVGISIQLLIDKDEGPGRPVVVLKNNTEKPLRYWIAKNQGWRVKVFNSDGKLIGSGGYELATSGSFIDQTIPPGGTGRHIVDIRWGILRDTKIPDICRVEIETPLFWDPNKDLSAKLSAYLKMHDESPTSK